MYDLILLFCSGLSRQLEMSFSEGTASPSTYLVVERGRRWGRTIPLRPLPPDSSSTAASSLPADSPSLAVHPRHSDSPNGQGSFSLYGWISGLLYEQLASSGGWGKVEGKFRRKKNEKE